MNIFKRVARSSLLSLIRGLGPERIASLSLEMSVDETRESSSVDVTMLERLSMAAWRRLMVEQFLDDRVGRDYGVTRTQKAVLVGKFQANTSQIPTGTSWILHLMMAKQILCLPKSFPGEVMECGCWKGASTSSLSLVCQLVGRKLIVCDSFQGLPKEPSGTLHVCPDSQIYGYYEPGMYAARLDEVKSNISTYGDLSVCEFVPGFFNVSLPPRTDPLAFAFLDVDLISSTRDCVKHIWPLLTDGGLIYTDDSTDMEVVCFWFDESWWQQELGVKAPGYVGTGCGLPIDLKTSSLGYVRKLLHPETHYQRVPWLRYLEESPPPPLDPNSVIE